MQTITRGGAPAIESANLGKRFGTHWAVRAVNLRVEARSIYGFLGLNGAGKTSTIRLALGLLRPTSGSVKVFGCDVAADRVSAARHIGALIEARAVYAALTGQENLDIARRLLNLPASEIGRVLEIVDLSDAARQRVGHYSLGMRQRLGLARALLGSPGLLILDEPMNGLDPAGMRDMRKVIREMPERCNASVFLSSHLLGEVAQTVTHIGLMHDGRLVKQGPIDAVLGDTNEVVVRTDRRSEAVVLLRRAGYAAREDQDERILLRGAGDRQAGDISRLLVEAGFVVTELSRPAPSLDRLFHGAEPALSEIAA